VQRQRTFPITGALFPLNESTADKYHAIAVFQFERFASVDRCWSDRRRAHYHETQSEVYHKRAFLVEGSVGNHRWAAPVGVFFFTGKARVFHLNFSLLAPASIGRRNVAA
jgi:hypothetical protein